jgi:hypothetical protein
MTVVNETITHVYTACHHPHIVQLKVDLDFVDATVLHKAPLAGVQFFEGVLKLLKLMDKCVRIISKRDMHDLIR